MRAFDNRDGVQTWPVVAFAQPVHIVDDGGDPGFDPAIVSVDRLRPANLGIDEIACLLLGYEQFDIIAQRALVAFQTKDIVSLFCRR